MIGLISDMDDKVKDKKKMKDENKMDKCQKYLKYTIYHLNKDEILLRLINLAEYKSL